MPMPEEWCQMYIKQFADRVLSQYAPVRKGKRKRRTRTYAYPYVRH